MFNRPLLGEVLIERGAARLEDIEEALARQAEAGGRLGDILIELERIDANQLAESLAVQLSYYYLEKVEVENVDLALLDRLPIGFARQRRVLPMRRIDGNLQVLMENPLDLNTVDQVSFLYQRRIVPVVSPPMTVMEAINSAYDAHDRERSNYGAVLDAEDEEANVIEPGFEDAVELLGKEDDDAPVIQFVNTTFLRAVRERASDIHIEPYEQYVSVRFRIDGVLKEVIQVPKRFQSSITARIKIMAGLDIAEKRLPQDGRIRIKIAGRDIDIRVATAPTTQGERITLRLLDQASQLLDLAAIGMPQGILNVVDRLIRKPNGIFLVTGPTGSGKTTTLYSCLNRVNSPDKNILTIEDPVEYQLAGISQTPVNPKINLTFASALRSFLRHDPDIIMVGEIRDMETAENAIQASLTGHLVFSTIHTNDASSAFTRLTDMGVEPFLAASSMLAIQAQRLVRRLCEHCRAAYQPSEAEISELGVTRAQVNESGGYFYKAVGCDECLDVGYHGRSGIYELLEVTDEIRQPVMARADAQSIKRIAMSQGMRTLRMDGADKVLAGITSTEEVFRVTQEEE